MNYWKILSKGHHSSDIYSWWFKSQFPHLSKIKLIWLEKASFNQRNICYTQKPMDLYLDLFFLLENILIASFHRFILTTIAIIFPVTFILVIKSYLQKIWRFPGKLKSLPRKFILKSKKTLKKQKVKSKKIWKLPGKCTCKSSDGN